MTKTVKAIAGAFGTLLFAAAIFLPQLAEARVVCHHGYYKHHNHCIRIHHHKHHR